MTWHPSNRISVPLFTLSMSSAAATTHKQIHTLPSTIPSCYRRLCVVTPAWTAYVPPRGAAAACSGSSSVAGCSRCCSTEGHTRQTMTTEGRGAIKQQIKPVRIYQEIRPCSIECAARDLAKFVCKIRAVSSVTIELLLSEIKASFGQNIVVECGSLSVRRGYKRILNNTEVEMCCVETL